MTLADALAWMESEGRGYKAAAKEFGFSVALLREARAAQREGDPLPEQPEEDAGDTPRADWVAATALLAAPRPAMLLRSFSSPARETMEGFERGGRVVGLTAGQFSLLDLLRAVLEITGPADVTLSTWTSGIRDTETAAWLLGTGVIRSFRLLTDRSFPGRQPAYCQRLVELFGEQAIVVTRTHAKFVVVENEDWTVTIQSSMNLNKNPRWEQFCVDDDPEIARFFLDFAAEVAGHQGSGLLDVVQSTVEDTFAAVVAQEAVVRRREAAAAAIEHRAELSALPPLERTRRILDDVQRSMDAAQAEGDHGLVARLTIPVSHAEKRYSEVAMEHGERMDRDEVAAWVRDHIMPILTDAQLEQLEAALSG